MWTVLFDIDGTLIRTHGAGMGAMGQTIRELYGEVDIPSVPVHGRTDCGIVSEIFSHLQLPIEGDMSSFFLAYGERLETWMRQAESEVLPGVLDLLERLNQHPDVALGILTGNMQRAAEIKLDHFELSEFFLFGGYGDSHCDRNDVAAAAQKQAESRLGDRFDSEKVWVIGDTCNDVRCARSIGAKALTVETGGETREVLSTSQPDLLLACLEDADAWFDTLRG